MLDFHAIAEFLEAYPRDLTPDQIHHGATSNDIQMAQLYSYGYGHIAYDYLNGQRDSLPERAAQLRAYEDAVDFRRLEAKLLEDFSLWEYRNEVNFYGLNYNMEKMWEPVVHGQWLRPNGHRYAANFSMNAIALESLETYTVRQQFVEKEGVDILEQPGVKDFNDRITGFMQEYDATVAILDWAKDQQGITIVPAPAQFEHSVTRANTDLLAINIARETVVGVQIKTIATDRTRRRYDPDRIVVVDSTDLGNVVVLPAKGKRKGEEDVPRPWPGILSMSRIGSISVRNNPDIAPEYVMSILRRKARAAMYLGKLRVNYRPYAKAIGQKNYGETCSLTPIAARRQSKMIKYIQHPIVVHRRPKEIVSFSLCFG